MTKNHLKRITAPKTWKISRKHPKFITRPLSGSSNFELGMPLSVWLKEKMKICNNNTEVFYLIKNDQVLVNSKKAKNQKMIVGLFDVILLPGLDEHYRIILNKKGYLDYVNINKEEADKKIIKLIGKTKLKKGIIQLNFNDSTNLIQDDKSKDIKTNSSVLYDLKNKKILEILNIEKGSLIFFTLGTHVGHLGKILDFDEKNKNKVKVLIDEKEDTVNVKNFIVIGKDKPLITVTKDSVIVKETESKDSTESKGKELKSDNTKEEKDNKKTKKQMTIEKKDEKTDNKKTDKKEDQKEKTNDTKSLKTKKQGEKK